MPLSDMTPTAQLALGRILRLSSRPERPGDAEEYEKCRRIFLAEAECAGLDTWARPTRGIVPYGWNRGVVE